MTRVSHVSTSVWMDTFDWNFIYCVRGASDKMLNESWPRLVAAKKNAQSKLSHQKQVVDVEAFYIKKDTTVSVNVKF